jgi:membrane protein YqaA with SNARE-associated domain
VDPVTIMAGVAAIGNILGGIGSWSASRGQSKAMEAAGRQARAEAGVNAQLELEQGDRAAAAAAVQAAQGGGLTGSALASIDDLASSAMFNARAAIYAGTVEGRNKDYEAKVLRRQGELTLVTSWFQAAGNAATAMGDMRAASLRRQEAAKAASQSRVSRGTYGPN